MRVILTTSNNNIFYCEDKIIFLNMVEYYKSLGYQVYAKVL